MLAGLGLAVSEGDVAGRGETDTGGGMRPPTPSLDEGMYSRGLGIGDAGTAGNADGESEKAEAGEGTGCAYYVTKRGVQAEMNKDTAY